MVNDHFSEEAIETIIRSNGQDSCKILSRESSNLEFKKSFNFKSMAKYSRTMAAFANNKGGYIVFGVNDRPRELIGLTEDAAKQMEDIQQESVTNLLNGHFAPEIKWDIVLRTKLSKIFGIIYVHESSQKPVICLKNHSDCLIESTIYYRYRARTEAIKYPELRCIMDTCRQDEERKWVKIINTIARTGVQDVGILDLNTARVSGQGSNTLLIDEALLGKLKFIKEGEFSEVIGAPTLKLIGNVESCKKVLRSNATTTRAVSLLADNIITDFLSQVAVSNPCEYLKSICSASSGNLPCYYYINLAKIDVQQAISIINHVTSRNKAKTYLIDRLRNNKTHHQHFKNTGTMASQKKREFIDMLLREEYPQITSGEVKYLLLAVQSLSISEITKHRNYIFTMLGNIYKIYYEQAESSTASGIRSAICWVDEALYHS